MAAGACVNTGYTEYRGFMFGKSEFIPCQASDIGSIDVRFSNNAVEIRFGGSWRKLSSFYRTSLLCRSLGYDGGRSTAVGLWRLGYPPVKVSFSGVSMSCARGVKSLEECTFTEFQEWRNYYERIHCENLDRDGKVRLLDGLRESEGRVEIYFNGSWSLMCGDEWYLDEANVVCRQLGYQKAVAVTARRRGLLSPSDDAMYFGRCKGNETWFKDCEKESSRSCSKEAEVICKENECKRSNVAIKD